MNNLTNPQYYNDNQGGTAICINGFTDTFTASAAVQCGETYHIKLAIADGIDDYLESIVVLEAGSFSSGSIDLVADAVSVDGADNLDEFYQSMVDGIGNTLSYEGQNDFPLGNWVDWKVDSTSTDDFEWEINPADFIEVDALVMEGCNDVQFQIIRPEANALFTDTLYLTVEGTAEEGEDFDPLFTQVIMEAGVTETNAVLGTEFNDGEEGPEYVTVSFDYINACGEPIVISSTVVILDPLPITATLDELLCHDDETAELDLTYSGLGGFGPFDFQWVWQGDTVVSLDEATTLPAQTLSLLNEFNGMGQVVGSMLTITDQCGYFENFPETFRQSVAREVEMCSNDRITLATSNLDVMGVSDVLVDGTSVIGLTPSVGAIHRWRHCLTSGTGGTSATSSLELCLEARQAGMASSPSWTPVASKPVHPFRCQRAPSPTSSHPTATQKTTTSKSEDCLDKSVRS